MFSLASHTLSVKGVACEVVVCVCTGILKVYEHDRVDKIRVDSAWQHVHMQTFYMWDQGSEVIYLFILSLVKAVHGSCCVQ